MINTPRRTSGSFPASEDKQTCKNNVLLVNEIKPDWSALPAGMESQTIDEETADAVRYCSGTRRV